MSRTRVETVAIFGERFEVDHLISQEALIDLLPVGRTKFYGLIRSGEGPPRVQFGRQGRVFYRAGAVHEWLMAQEA